MNKREFNTGEPLAFLITWTTYGTWLPGDQCGWNRKGELETQLANPLREETALAEMKEPLFRLTEDDRQIAEETIRIHCEIRGWDLPTPISSARSGAWREG